MDYRGESMNVRYRCHFFAASALGFALLLGLAADARAAGRERLARQYYKNEKHGFQFVPMYGWTSFPPQPGEETVVVHFRTEKAERGPGLSYTPECYVYLFPKDAKKDFPTYFKERWRGAVIAPKKVFRSSKVPENTQYAVSLSSGQSRGAGYAVAYHRDDGDIVVMYFCNERYLQKKYLRHFVGSLMSFRFIDKKAASDPGSGEGEDGEEKRAIHVRYEQEKDRVPPGWILVPPKFMKNFYLVYYNCEQKDANSVMTRIMAVRPEYSRYFPPLNQEFVDAAAPILRVCKTQRDFAYYSGMHNPGILGYWSPGQEELVIFRKSQYGMSLDELFMVLQHEGFHQYIFYACGRVSPCISLNEGGAEFFASFQPAGGKMVPTFENRMRSGTIKGAVGSNTFVPLRTFLEYTQQQHYSNAGICYAQGWALTEFLLLGDRSKVRSRFKKEWKEIIPTYFQTLQAEVKKEYDKLKARLGEKGHEGKNDRENFGHLAGAGDRKEILKKALEKSLEGIDLEELTEVWKLFVKKDL